MIEVWKKLELQAYCLFIPTLPAPVRTGHEANYAVMESFNDDGKTPAGTQWMPVATTACCSTDKEAEAIKASLHELETYSSGDRFGPFARPGWLRELLQWTQQQIGPLGLRLTGGFRQLNSSPTFSLVRLETDGPAIWFKATGEPNSHELPVSVSLARLFPRCVPAILGVHASWNGWLSPEVPGTSLDEITQWSTWEQVAEELAELQIASVGKSAELLECKCKDLRISKLVALTGPFLARMSELMAEQKKPSPAALTNVELAFLGDQLREACSLLQGLGLPDTLGHIDFNPGNIVVSAHGCVFLDWAEGCVTQPLITFDYLREHLKRSQTQEAAAIEKITAAYARPWRCFYSPDDLRRAMDVSPLVAVFAYALACKTWSSSNAVENLQGNAYLRSLTRRMYREAMGIAGRSERCLA